MENNEEKEINFGAHPGSGPQYLPRTLHPDADSPLAGKTVLFLGSSVTEGYASLNYSFADFLQQKDGIRSVKEAVGGTTLVNDSEDSYIPRMKTIDPNLAADLFVCQLSTNDFAQDKDPERIYAAIEEIIDYARSTWNCPIMFCASPRFDRPTYADAVEKLKEIAARKQIGIIDLWSNDTFNAISDAQRELYMFDPVHPTMAGYRLWWLPEMEKEIKEYIAR